MLDKARIRALIPHAGTMCLLDDVKAWDADSIRCTSLTHRDPHHPLRANGRLSALHLIEYGAQAMAVHGALLASGGPQPGMIGALRDIRLHVADLDEVHEPLVIAATRRLARSDGLIYDFVVTTSGTRTLCEGRITVALHA